MVGHRQITFDMSGGGLFVTFVLVSLMCQLFCFEMSGERIDSFHGPVFDTVYSNMACCP